MPARHSSPVDPVKDDIDHVHDFFTWKIASVMNDKVKDRWAQAFRVAQDGLWSIEDLKISVRGESSGSTQLTRASLTACTASKSIGRRRRTPQQACKRFNILV
jgi:hypothetical protein